MRTRNFLMAFALIAPAVVSAGMVYLSWQPDHASNWGIVVSELMDGQNVATVLPVDAYTRIISLPETSIDLTIDRRQLLKALFSAATKGNTTDIDKVKAWVRYLQDRIAHPLNAPLMENGQAIYDPLWILENRIAHCGQTNRLVVDGLSAAGFRARVVQLKAHVAAEVWIDGSWRFLDADWLNLGQFVQQKDKTIPSALDIFNDRKLLKGLQTDAEFKIYPVNIPGLSQRNYAEMFSVKPFYYEKMASIEQERNIYYGWNYYKTIQD
jgi:transglutaminase-like putative cysteine protease